MKIPKSVFTHAAVCAVGAAVALLVQSQNPAHTGESEVAHLGRRVSSGREVASADLGGAGRSGVTRESSQKERQSTRANETAAQRLAEIVRIGDPLERQAALMDLIHRLGPDEFAAVAEQYRTMDHFGNSRGEYDLILRGWAKADPLGALEYTTKQANPREQSAVVLASWAGHDAAAAERWAMDHHEGDAPNPYLVAVIRGIAAHDIVNATRLAETMPRSRERGEAMDAIVRALFMQGVDTALAYPSAIQDPQLRAGAISMIAERLSAKDPDQAAQWLAAAPDENSQIRSARRVAEALAQKNLSQATEWVRKLSPAAQAEAARGVIGPMSSGDITATAKWVSSLSGIPHYDRVIEEFVWSCDYRAPEQSAAWIAGVANEDQRTRLYHRMLGEWSRRDAAVVRDWVANNEVPQSVSRRFNR